ncbi:MAG: hypothetical protein JXB32_09345 [Deltaproteobacteria bacterium]|nr:hypothetical protein [Deltaproteobacteria bacterium]
MPKPLAICLEDTAAIAPSRRYLRCVALSGADPGLRVTDQGEVLWRREVPAAFELWISQDDRLILYRRPEGARIVVRRDGRWLEAPAEKPVVLLDQDLVELGERRFRIHVHGAAPVVHEPSWLEDQQPAAARRPLARTAAALALGAALGGAGCKKTGDKEAAVEPAADAEVPIEVREFPPASPVLAEDAVAAAAVDGGAEAAPEAAAEPGDAASILDQPPDIEVRVSPPKIAIDRMPDATPQPDATPSVPATPVDAGAAEPASPDAGAAQEAGAQDVRRLEVRIHPPRPVLRDFGRGNDDPLK